MGSSQIMIFAVVASWKKSVKIHAFILFTKLEKPRLGLILGHFLAQKTQNKVFRKKHHLRQF